MELRCSFCKRLFDSQYEGLIRFWRDRRFNLCSDKCVAICDEYIQGRIEKEGKKGGKR